MKRSSAKISGNRSRSSKRVELKELTRLYEADETAWLERMSDLINAGYYEQLDYHNLCEYLRDMARRDRREVLSRLTALLAHRLKWDYQPRKRSKSWNVTIMNQRHELQDLLESQTLKNHAVEVLPKAYGRAVQNAVGETGLSEEEFPAVCPYQLEDILAEE